MAAGSGSSPYDEPTGEIDLGEAAPMRRRRVAADDDRDSFYARHASGGRSMSRVDDLDDIDPDEVDTQAIPARTTAPPPSAAPAPAAPAPAPAAAPAETAPVADSDDEIDRAEAPTRRFSASPAAATPAPAEDLQTDDFTALPPTRAADYEYADADVVDRYETPPPADDRLRSVEEDLADAQRRARRGTLDIGLLLLRCAVGAIAIAHGTQKLFGWWNGPRLSGFEDMLVNAPNPAIGFQADAARPLAILGALSETLGGLMLVVGLFTPLAASAVVGVMLVAAAYKATLAGGVWFFAADPNGAGLEYELLLVMCAAAIILTGPGRISLDAPRGWSRRPSWGSLALLLVGIGAAVAVWLVFNGTDPFQSPGNPAG
ncbi:Putative oxidoreductase MhqP [Gordonia insulae]|uniref:Oxidoreductase MhqP n=2 Tax=Gordonia insulae TaxID=2420509 RepID=A0A3G8JUJ8_9ACTN|nr:Putative oxidoreductase MhqP [Gordonia insulae]